MPGRDSPEMQVEEIVHIGVSVFDLEKSVQFYR